MISELVYIASYKIRPIWVQKATYLGTKNDLFGYKKQPIWVQKTTYLGTKNDLFGYKKRPIWVQKTTYLGTFLTCSVGDWRYSTSIHVILA